MIFERYISANNTAISFSFFEGQEADEFHWMVIPASNHSLKQQANDILTASVEFLASQGMSVDQVVLQRYFFSDISNQREQVLSLFTQTFAAPASVIQQPSTTGNKIVAWFYAVKFKTAGTSMPNINEGSVILNHNGYRHLLTCNMMAADQPDSHTQTQAIFNNYIDSLKAEKLTIEEHCIRTWLFVRDVDNNYNGMVKARNEIFDQLGLTNNSHYIASTGIEGQTAQTDSLVMMDAYSIGGIEPEQIKYLKALDHLSPTHDYGVAFERGTAVDYGDRRHIFISGTASIDYKGDILYLYDIEKQTDRVFENISALLNEAESELNDMASIIVYLRDWADDRFVSNYMNCHFSHIPFVTVWAPVCRHGWLIEVECIAIKAIERKEFRNY